MKKNSTLFYYINNFKNDRSELFTLDSLLDERYQEFNDVFDLLDKNEIEIDEQIVKNIIVFSKSYNELHFNSKK